MGFIFVGRVGAIRMFNAGMIARKHVLLDVSRFDKRKFFFVFLVVVNERLCSSLYDGDLLLHLFL